MLDHLHVQDDIESLARGCQRFRARGPVVDLQSLLASVGRGCPDVLFRGIRTHDAETQACHRFAEEASSTTYVEKPEALERRHAFLVPAKVPDGVLPDEAEPDGVKLMENAEFPVRIPPFRGECRETGYLGSINCGLGRCDVRHCCVAPRVA